jgi:uncharacterized protein YdhG (YjbR/CyaY superfamily)
MLNVLDASPSPIFLERMIQMTKRDLAKLQKAFVGKQPKRGRAGAVHEACPPHRSAGIVDKMTASTVAQYLAALPADRRAALSAVRKVINENLPEGYEEGMQFGMIGWYVPLSLYPAGYGENPKVPLPLVALASQKSGMVLHFLCFYGHPTLSTWFTSEYKKSGKKLDMGKGCVRFKKLEDLALDVVSRTVARVSVEEHMANYRAARALLGKGRNAGEGAAGLSKSSTKKGTTKSEVNKAKLRK